MVASLRSVEPPIAQHLERMGLMPTRNSIHRSRQHAGVALGHAALDLDGAAYGVDHAGELNGPDQG
jgi:hypothetical protein